jgi:hypothetical protein
MKMLISVICRMDLLQLLEKMALTAAALLMDCPTGAADAAVAVDWALAMAGAAILITPRMATAVASHTLEASAMDTAGDTTTMEASAVVVAEDASVVVVDMAVAVVAAVVADAEVAAEVDAEVAAAAEAEAAVDAAAAVIRDAGEPRAFLVIIVM